MDACKASRWHWAGRARTALAAAVLALGSGLALAYQWTALEEDGVHDPDNPAVGILQPPAEALSVLPPDTAGNHVRWVEALRGGYISPRAYLHKETENRVLDSTILMKNTGDAPYVLFPHEPHTDWLDCDNCHERIFASKAGATPISMLAILSGEYCGRCHGAVSFPLTECRRCHSVENPERPSPSGWETRPLAGG